MAERAAHLAVLNPRPRVSLLLRRWADLMRRVFEVDVLACPGCGGRLRLVAVLDASDATRRILRHLGFLYAQASWTRRSVLAT